MILLPSFPVSYGFLREMGVESDAPAVQARKKFLI